MKLLKQIICVLTAAVISVSGALTATAAVSPPGADFIITDTSPNDVTDKTPPDTTLPTTSPAVTAPASDKSFQPVTDYRSWKLWDGKSEFLENTDYYIFETTRLDGEYTLPQSSRLLVDKGLVLRVSTNSTFSVYGTLIVAPEAELICTGTMSLAEGGLIENYGMLTTSVNGVVNISSVFASYSGSQTEFSGKTLVYAKGKFIGYGNVSTPRFSEVTVTGEWLADKKGQLYIDGKFTTTLNGKLELAGYAYFREHARITNSGRFVIRTTVNYFIDPDARITNTQSGRILDHRNPDFVDPDAAAPKPDVPEPDTPKPDTPSFDFVKGIKGIDVSSWQGVIDWQKVKDAGVQFAIIRSSSGPRVDAMFDYNITEAQRVGIAVGVYHYCYALTPEEARDEAIHFINTICRYRIDFPVMFDFEDNSQAKLGKEKLTRIAEAFLGMLKSFGYYPMIYSYRNWLQNNLDMDRLSEYDVAVAEWNVSAPNYDRPYGIWQYSCKGQISGIEGDVDLDICYKDYKKIIREGGYNQFVIGKS